MDREIKCHPFLTMVAVQEALVNYPNHTQMIEDIEKQMDKRYKDLITKEIFKQCVNRTGWRVHKSGYNRPDLIKYKQLLDLVVTTKDRLTRILHLPKRMTLDECIDEVEKRLRGN